MEEYEIDEDALMPYEDTLAERMELMNFKGNKCRLKTTVSGPIVEAEIFPLYAESMSVTPKKKRTPTQERKIYERRQRKRLTRLINANFGEGDTWATVDYSPEYLPATFAEAQNNIQNYIKRVAYYCKRHNLPKLKYVYCTSQSDKDGEIVRFHHHVVLNFRDRDALEAMWKYGGRPNTRKLIPDKDGLEGMARYISAQGRSKKAFCVSQGLKPPAVYTAESKITSRQALRMMTNRLFAEEKIAKLYPKYELISLDAKFNPNGGGYYIYAKMRKPWAMVRAESANAKLTAVQVARIRTKLDTIDGVARELESLKRELERARGGRIKVVKSNITRLTKTRERLLKWFDTCTKKMDRSDRALLRDRYVNGVGLDDLSRSYYYADRSAVSRKINKVISETFSRGVL